MDAKEIKSTVTNLEKSTDDVTILKLLNILNDGVKPSEKLLRETKVGVAVNKYRTNANNEISSLVKKMIRTWRDVVQAEKNKKKSASPVVDKKESESNGSTPSKFHSGPRNPKIDGISTNVYDDSTRNASISALYTALAIERNEMGEHILAVARDIESEVFKLEYMAVTDGYRNKLRTFVMNLRNKKNPELRDRLLTSQILPKDFVKMSPNEMAPETLKKEIEKLHKQNLFDAQGATEKRAVTDRFTCGKCKHKKVSYYQMQTRSADEPLTTFCTCENCGLSSSSVMIALELVSKNLFNNAKEVFKVIGSFLGDGERLFEVGELSEVDDHWSDRVGHHDLLGGESLQDTRQGDQTDQLTLLVQHWQSVETVGSQKVEGLFHGVGQCDGDNWSLVSDQVFDGLGVQELVSLVARWAGFFDLESVGLHPFVVDELGQVRSDGVRENNHNNVIFSQILGDLEGSLQGRTGRSTNQNTFFSNDSSSPLERVGVIRLDPVVNQLSVQNIRNKVVTDTFNQVRVGGVLGNTRNGTTGTSSSNQVGDLTLGSFPDLETSSVVVSLGVGFVRVSVQNHGVWNFLFQFSGNTNVRLWGVPCGLSWGSDDLSTQSFQDRHFLVGHLFWQGDNSSVAFNSTDQCQTNTGVTGGRFDQGVAWLNSAGFFGLQNHVLGDSVLNGATSIE